MSNTHPTIRKKLLIQFLSERMRLVKQYFTTNKTNKKHCYSIETNYRQDCKNISKISEFEEIVRIQPQCAIYIYKKGLSLRFDN